MKPKIVVANNMDFSPEQVERLKSMGDCTIYNDRTESTDEWFERVKDADVICTGIFGLKHRVYDLKDKFISLPFVGYDFLDLERLKGKNIVISNSPGCNKEAVAEWIVGMIMTFYRNFNKFIRIENKTEKEALEMATGLNGKNVTILGRGNIGSQVRKILEAFDMNVTVFKRGDDLLESVKDADVVVNCLSTNPSTEGILDKKFFNSLKKGSFFVSVTPTKLYDIDGLFEALDKGILAGAANDAGSARVGDLNDSEYVKLLKHPKMLVTPHIAWNTDSQAVKGNEMMLDNIEAWLKGKPINVVK